MNTPVSLDIAKLLKEKKFASNDEGCEGCYINNHYTKEEYLFYKDTVSIYPAPTIANVVMWFHKNHGIWISVDFNLETVWFYNIVTISEDGGNILDGFNSPEEAYEAAIEYTLKNLI